MDPLTVKTNKQYAYVVTLFGGDSYLQGVLTVGSAFHRLGDNNSVDLICLVTSDVSQNARNLIKLYYNHVILIDYLIFDEPIHLSVLKSKPQYAKVWTKFHALRLTSYEKICLIDADYLPHRSMLSVFDYETPASVTETPTGISLENFDLNRDETYSPEWADLFNLCCQSGKVIPGIIPLILLYSNNLDVEQGRYSSFPEFTGNFYYGGMNASVMLLEPNIFEFRNIIKDLETYSPDRLKFFYPEQQYLTLRYAFGKTLTSDRIPEIIQEFMEFIKPHFDIYYDKLAAFKNILSKEQLSFCAKDTKCSNNNLTKTTDIVQIVANVLGYYLNHDYHNINIGPWTSLGLEFFVSEYYDILPPQEKWLGFPILQQKKLWTKEGIDLIKYGKASLGYAEWFEELVRVIWTLDSLNITNSYIFDKIQEWSDIVQYYKEVTFKMDNFIL